MPTFYIPLLSLLHLEVPSHSVYTFSIFHSSVAMVGPGNSSCAAMCQCTNAVYEPVCGNNSVMYFSACSAGCQNRIERDDGVSCTAEPYAITINSLSLFHRLFSFQTVRV